MRVVIIGGTGHVGTFLVPRLIDAGHDVICVSRQKRKPYRGHDAWNSVKLIRIDRKEAEKKKEFGRQIRALSPDVVIDLICFTLESAEMLVQALHGHVHQFLHCGTIWVHGQSEQVPTLETQERKPFGTYGINKAAIESYLISIAAREGFPATVLHPGHIVGPGWMPINPVGNRNPLVFQRLAQGREVVLPNKGLETLHHVHADDVAQSFMQAIANRAKALGESFHVVSAGALTMRGYATAMASWFGQQAKLGYLPWEEWKNVVEERDADLTLDHLLHSPNCSIEKAQRLLNYQPGYSSLQAVQESCEAPFLKSKIR